MKTFIVIAIVLVVLFLISQLWAHGQVKDIEMYPYKVIETIGEVEIREYEKANFIYTTMDADTYEKASSKGFGILAGYIFGGNDAKKSIAMTSPVEMEMKENMTMKFIVPAEYDISELPRPDNMEVKFITEEERKLAAIGFGGFAMIAGLQSIDQNSQTS